MKYIFKTLGNSIDAVVKFMIKGLLIIVPLWIMVYVVARISNFVIGISSRLFRMYWTQDDMSRNLWLYPLAVFTSLFLVFILGYISEKTKFGSKIDSKLDSICSNIKGIGGIYKFVNQIAQMFEGKKQNLGRAIVFPFLNDKMLQMAFITNEELVTVYNHHYKMAVKHYVVNFPPAFSIMGGTTVLLPAELVEDERGILHCNVSSDEAYKFNLSGGSILPKSLVENVEARA